MSGFTGGNLTGTGANQTIATGLGATPTLVSIIPAASGTSVNGLYSSNGTFYVTVTSGKLFRWTAGIV